MEDLLFHAGVKLYSVVTGNFTWVYVKGGRQDGPKPRRGLETARLMGQMGAAKRAPATDDKRRVG